jgi:hypothetical protein
LTRLVRVDADGCAGAAVTTGCAAGDIGAALVMEVTD